MSRCEVEYYESVTNRCPVQDLLNSLEVKE
jgi:hypothetical protein